MAGLRAKESGVLSARLAKGSIDMYRKKPIAEITSLDELEQRRIGHYITHHRAKYNKDLKLVPDCTVCSELEAREKTLTGEYF